MKDLRLFIGLIVAVLLNPTTTQGQDTLTYKTTPQGPLDMIVLRPEGKVTSQESLPAVLFFFGGGWKGGQPSHFLPQARYFTKRGLICFLADYRTESRHQTSPFESLMDAKSAVRWVRKNGPEMGVDTSKLVVGGGSAGGHLAAAAAVTQGFDDPQDDLSISAVGSLLVLFNPVIDNGPGGYGYERIGEVYPRFSPLHNLRSGTPPTLFLLGTEDHLVPVATARYYQTVMERTGGYCDLRLYEGGKHGFFNLPNTYSFRQTVLAMDEFLVKFGYLPPLKEGEGF
ncbi:MAG: alpha/beta hydrolase [Bacteroidota bacterium]